MLHWTLLLPLNATPDYDALVEAGWRCGRDDAGIRRCQQRLPLGGVSGRVDVIFCGVARPEPCLVTYRRRVVGRGAQDLVAAAWSRAAEKELGFDAQDWVPLAGREWLAAEQGQEVMLRASPPTPGGRRWVLLGVGDEGMLEDVGWTALSPTTVAQEGWGPDTACAGDPIARLEAQLLVDYDEAMAELQEAENEVRRAELALAAGQIAFHRSPTLYLATLKHNAPALEEAEAYRDTEVVDTYSPTRAVLRSESFQCYCEQRRLQPTEGALQLLLAEREGKPLPRAVTAPVGPPPR